MDGSEITAQGTHCSDNLSSLTGLYFLTESEGASKKLIKKQAPSMDPHESVAIFIFPESHQTVVTRTRQDWDHKLQTICRENHPFLKLCHNDIKFTHKLDK